MLNDIKLDLWPRVTHKSKAGIIMKPSLQYQINDSFRIIVTLVAHFDLELHQMDVKTAFLNGDLEKKVYMKQPEGFDNNT
jgi:hypothetical protein